VSNQGPFAEASHVPNKPSSIYIAGAYEFGHDWSTRNVDDAVKRINAAVRAERADALREASGLLDKRGAESLSRGDNRDAEVWRSAAGLLRVFSAQIEKGEV